MAGRQGPKGRRRGGRGLNGGRRPVVPWQALKVHHVGHAGVVFPVGAFRRANHLDHKRKELPCDGSRTVTGDGRARSPPSRGRGIPARRRSEEHTSELQSLMRISYAVFCLKKKKT